MDLLILITIFIIYTYIAIKDWKTGFISLILNFSIFILSIIYAFINKTNLTGILLNLLIFVVPFILIEFIFQVFGNKEKDEEKFLIGGGDIILFASMSIILSLFGMVVMFFFASLSSLIAGKITNKKRIPFAPFLEFGFLIACLFANKFYILFFTAVSSGIMSLL